MLLHGDYIVTVVIDQGLFNLIITMDNRGHNLPKEKERV